MLLITVAKLQSHGEKESHSPFLHFFLPCPLCQGVSAITSQLISLFSPASGDATSVGQGSSQGHRSMQYHGILEERNVGGKSKVKLRKKPDLFYMASVLLP